MSRRKSSSKKGANRSKGPGNGAREQVGQEQEGQLPPIHNEDAALWAEVTKSLTPLKDEHDRLHFGPLLDEKPVLSPQWQSAQNTDKSGGRQGNGKSADGPRPAVNSHNPPRKPVDPVPDISESHGFSRREMRQIDSGRQPIEARLDLHGMYQSAAHTALRGFLERSQSRGLRHVLVITGKGRSSRPDDLMFGDPETGVLRRMVPLWLGEPDLRSIVTGYNEAPRRFGGEGALYVRLRRTRQG